MVCGFGFIAMVWGLCSGSEVGSYFRPIDFVYHSTLGLRVIKNKKKSSEFEVTEGPLHKPYFALK